MFFSNLNGLSKLPYFKKVKGMLRLREDVLEGKILDMHTHLGWHYLLTQRINLWKKSKTLHFFPPDIPIETDRYTAYDFTEPAKKTCTKEVVRAAYDTRGYSSTHTIPNILEEMDRLCVGRAVLLAIDFPVLSQNSQEQLEAVNSASDSRDRLPVFISLHPLQLNKEQVLQHYIKQGARGIKLHPQMQLFKPSRKDAHSIYLLAAKYRLPVLFHTGLSPISPPWQRPFVEPSEYEKVFSRFPNTDFIIGHAGGVDGYRWAADMANRYPRVFVETSGQPPQGIEHLVKHMDTDRIFYGSDWPFYPMALPLAKTLLATEKHKKVRKKIFRENAEKLLQR